ncbi:5-deoxy-glucuronate isomerase [Aurantimonas sp. VKM B-3413]|uniref:5-deoxy-glucuronate isomerase n=1 Tax=Aurantimonas sp. VKM B-3413 TaxID=2779401 RepID=UPI001E411FDF|nr:5-deoxy-glucuronate isomerase [Aurantimonas sp. VKM B-3413]MCB8837140.1 5-deoxy-glucuronate isomerase [Aurantimonas sp. VKM B-3413]
MSDLLRKPTGTTGKVHDITPQNARSPLSPDWSYVGFSLYRLAPGERAGETTGDREVILVLVEGKAKFTAAGKDFGEMGERMNVFEKTPPHCLYVPNGSEWEAEATTPCTLAVCTAPGKGGHETARIGPESITLADRGKGTNLRHINAIAMEERDVADSLLVTEVFTPAGHWSSYPPHRHDEDAFPEMTYLEETYYHRLNPAQGYGHQRVFTEDGSLDETMSVSNHDVVLVPKGHHPCAAPYGYEMYYLNVMAGPLRKWRFKNHPDHDWIARRDA